MLYDPYHGDLARSLKPASVGFSGRAIENMMQLGGKTKSRPFLLYMELYHFVCLLIVAYKRSESIFK